MKRHRYDRQGLTARDLDAVDNLRRFLSWGWAPGTAARVPAAVIAYALGATSYCPPIGTI